MLTLILIMYGGGGLSPKLELKLIGALKYKSGFTVLVWLSSRMLHWHRLYLPVAVKANQDVT